MENYIDKVYSVHGYSSDSRPFLKYAWREVARSDLVVVEAPTGYGKTTLSQTFTLYTLKHGFKNILAYPIRSLLEDQYSKFNGFYEKLGYRSIVDTRYMYHSSSKYFVKPVTLTTIDTLSLTLFGLEPHDLDKALKHYWGLVNYSLGHYLFSRATTLLSNIVLDEVHLLADSTKSLNFLASLIKIGYQNSSKILMLTATLPSALKNVLKEIYSEVVIVEFNESIDQSFVEEKRKKKIEAEIRKLESSSKYDHILDWLKSKVREYGKCRAIIVFNTVREAIDFYEKIKSDETLKIPKILLHSRFKEDDRRSRIEYLKKLVKSGEEYIVVSTQVIEAGVDISSNIFITDIAPANSLIQRLGRFLRYEGENEGSYLVWFEEGFEEGSGKMYKVYDGELVKKTRDYLKNNIGKLHPHIPSSYRKLLDYVYSVKDYRVDYREVDELSILTLNVTSIRLSVEKFVDLEGSFIREGLNIPVIPEEKIKEIGLDPDKLRSEILSINIRNIRREHIAGKLIISEDGSVELKQKNVEKEILDFREKGFARRLLSTIFSSNFIAYVVRGRYDSERGLVIE